MERIRRCAEISVGRACAFAMLGILTFVLGMSGEPSLAVRSAAILLSLMAVVLWMKAHSADTVDYRRREVWLLMGRCHDLPEERAHVVISGVMRDVLDRWAARIARPAAACWVIAVIDRLFG